MTTVNEKILDAQIKHSIFLERYKTGVLKKIVALLNKSEEDLIDQIESRLKKINDRGFDIGATTTKRLNTMLDDIRAKRNEVYSVIGEKLIAEMNDFSEYEADFQIRLAENAGVQASFTMPSNAQLKAIVNTYPFQGRLLKDWVKGIGQKQGQQISDAIRLGITEGQTIDDMVRRIRGTKARKYQDGILDIGRRDAASVVRTAVAHVQTRAKEEVYYANADVVKKLQYVATLDSRTTKVCAARDGKLYDLGKQPVLPAHWGCRSVMIAYFESDIEGTRASVDGPVPAKTTYSSWLKKQPIDVQEDVLGVEGAKMFRAGTPLDRFVDKSGKAYTLDELKARE